MKVEKTEIFVNHLKGRRRYPFAFYSIFNDAGVEIGSGIGADDTMTHQVNPIINDQDVPSIVGQMIDPPFLGSPSLATGEYAIR